MKTKVRQETTEGFPDENVPWAGEKGHRQVHTLSGSAAIFVTIVLELNF